VPPTIGFSKIPVKLEVTKVPQAIALDAQGCLQIFFSLKGCREPKKVEKHCFKALFSINLSIFPRYLRFLPVVKSQNRHYQERE
jgi:hypothetical protein